MSRKKNGWGGPWTEKKLDAFGKYVRSYLKILKRQTQWETIYFDGFAGSGHRGDPSEGAQAIIKQLSLTEEEESIYKGAAERVLTLVDCLVFDHYYFVDREEELVQLKEKLESLPNTKNTNLHFVPGDCNKWLSRLAAALQQKKYAALVLLDPFGMQINWNSIASLKGTRSDVWILVPTGVIINRLLDRNGKLQRLEKLQSFFGLTEVEIKSEFYKTEITADLFGEQNEVVTKIVKPIEHIMNLYIRQLNTIWRFVTKRPLRLDNRKGQPLFHLVFASNNATALKIASDIIKTK